MTSLAHKTRQIESQVATILREVHLEKLTPKQRDLISTLRQDLTDARIYTNAYETAQSQQIQQASAKQARKWLDQARKNILSISEFDVFGAVDVAHLSAQIEQITEGLE